MTTALLCVAAIGLITFIFAQPKVKALIAFFLMMQFFDMAPNIVFGMYVWDYGAILMLVLAADVYMRKEVIPPIRHGYITALKWFLGWLLLCFVWSLVIYRYPVVHTIKNARYMLLGYLMTLVFIRLFAVQPDSFAFLMRWIYRLTFVLMPVVMLQYVLKRPILFGLVSDYQGSIRAVPIFLPLCLLNFWIIAARFLAGERLAIHQLVYQALVLIAVALSFTRGIYISVIAVSLVLGWTMLRERRLKPAAIPKLAIAGALVMVLLLASGIAEKVSGRAASGVELLGASESSVSTKPKDDTFTGRLGLVAERFALTWAENPVVGYGFIHEDDVPTSVRSRLRFGTVLGGTAEDPEAYSRTYAFTGDWVLGFYTSDIAWADIIVATGCGGVVLLLVFMFSFVYGHYRNRVGAHPMGHAVKTGLFLQIVMMFLLTFDGNTLYGAVHIPALLFAGYSLTGNRHSKKKPQLPQPMAYVDRRDPSWFRNTWPRPIQKGRL